MRPNYKKASQVVALLLTCALLQVCVVAAPTTLTPNEAGANAASRAAVFGRLATFGEGQVIVNGNAVASGTTILSGAQLETPYATAATINLGSAGKLDIAPKTSLTLSFDRSNVTVNVIAGDALVTTNEGVKGTLTTPDGKTKMSDGTSASSIGSAMYDASADPNAQNSTAKKCVIARLPCEVFWALVGTGTALGFYLFFLHHRGSNPSLSAP